MAEERFRAGDIVVLNGQRLTVLGVGGEYVRLRRAGSVGIGEPPILADLLPAPEYHEPEWQPGDVVRDNDGVVYLRIDPVHRGMPWRSFSGAEWYDKSLPRPLTRLVPEDDAAPQVLAALDAVDSGEFATASRDFGRGAAEVSRRVREALKAPERGLLGALRRDMATAADGERTVGQVTEALRGGSMTDPTPTPGWRGRLVAFLADVAGALEAATTINERMLRIGKPEGLNLGNMDRLVREAADLRAALAASSPQEGGDGLPEHVRAAVEAYARAVHEKHCGTPPSCEQPWRKCHAGGLIREDDVRLGLATALAPLLGTPEPGSGT